MTRTARAAGLAARLSLSVLVAVLVVGAASVHIGVLGSEPAFANEPEDNLTVEIVDSSTPPPGVPPVQPVVPVKTGGPLPLQNRAPSLTPPAATQQTLTDPAAADAALGEQGETMAGLIYVSGARTAPRLSVHPDGGEVSVVLSIRNVSGETIDGAAQFWITTAWGWAASEVLDVEVLALAPGETRELTASLPGPGQWVFYQANAKFTPPTTVDGVELGSISRTENFIVFPLFAVGIAAIAGLGVGGYFWWARMDSRRGVPVA